MRNNIGYVVVYVLGIASGSLAAYLIFKDKYEQRIHEEVEALKGEFEKKPKETCDKNFSEPKNKETLNDLRKIINDNRYDRSSEKVDYGALTRPASEKPKETKEDLPYVIPPDSFGEFDEYEQISLTYYEGDGVLADDNDEPVEDADAVIGKESLEHFGEYEDDSVYVRNDRLKSDYEILKDLRSYSEVLAAKPYLYRPEGS